MKRMKYELYRNYKNSKGLIKEFEETNSYDAVQRADYWRKVDKLNESEVSTPKEFFHTLYEDDKLIRIFQ